jgi:F0F1-type ATP synthase membrane subunit b/b'
MIKIDLLPREGGAKPKKPRPGGGGGAPKAQGGSAVMSLVILVVGGLMLGGAGFAGYTVWDTVQKGYALKDEKERKKKKLQDEAKEKKEEFEALEQKYEKAVDKARVLLMLDPPDRLLWAEKLNMLAEMRPDGVALTTIKLVEKVKMIETPASKKRKAEYEANKGKKEFRGMEKPVKEEMPLISQTFTIIGVAYSQQPAKRLDDITKFGDLIEEYHVDMEDKSVRRFMNNFVPEVKIGDLQVLDDYLKSGRNVTQFEFTLQTKTVEVKNSEEVLNEMVADAERRESQKKAKESSDLTSTQRAAGQFVGADIGGGGF